MSTAKEHQGLITSVMGSLLLLAAIIAGIMGLGWALVKIAAVRAPAKDAMRAEANKTIAATDGRIELSMFEAMILGDGKLVKPRHKPPAPRLPPFVDNWTNVEDRVEWRFQVTEAGRYRLDVLYGCDAKNAGGEYEAAVTSAAATLATLTGRVVDTGDEMELRTDRLGEVAFDAPGWHVLTFRPRHVPGKSLMRLSGVSFVPVRSP